MLKLFIAFLLVTASASAQKYEVLMLTPEEQQTWVRLKSEGERLQEEQSVHTKATVDFINALHKKYEPKSKENLYFRLSEDLKYGIVVDLDSEMGWPMNTESSFNGVIPSRNMPRQK